MRLWLLASLLAVAPLVACSSSGASLNPRLATASLRSRDTASPIAIVGSGTDAHLDALVRAFMLAQRVPNAQLAVSERGTTVFSHAYTYTGLARSTTTPATIMRLASNSKAWTAAAVYQLVRDGKLSLKTRVFDYLDIKHGLPEGATVDPRVFDITVEEMVQGDSTAGWDSAQSGYDPSFEMRQMARDLGRAQHVTPRQYMRFGIAQPLQDAPGTHAAYCNFCFDVLAWVIAKAAGMPYITYLQEDIATPSGAGDIEVSPTVGKRLPGEVAHYYNTEMGLSAYYPQSMKPWPFPYGGDGGVLEIAAGDGGLATSAQSQLALMNHYTIWGYGPRPRKGVGEGRAGGIPGTSTWAEQLPNDTNYAFDINSNEYELGPNPKSFDALQAAIERALCGSTPNCGSF